MFDKSIFGLSIRPQSGRSMPSVAEGHQFPLADAWVSAISHIQGN
jgi:hypothetical protein